MSAATTILGIVILTVAFQGLFYGSSLVQSSYPPLRSVDFGSCSDQQSWASGVPIIGAISDGTKTIACWVGNFFLIIGNVFVFLYGTVVFIINVMTFNVPGAPTFIRFLIGGILGGSLLFVVATSLIRGSKA